MIDETTQEQAALYALDLLTPAEARAFAEKLPADAELREFVTELCAVGEQLALSVPQHNAPDFLKQRILDQIRGEQPAAASRSHWFPWALAACLAVACVFLIADRHRLKDRLAAVEHRDTLSRLRIAELNSLLDSAPGATAVAVWDGEQQSGVLNVEKLPATLPDRDYQLWIVDPQYEIPVDAGVFQVAANGATRISFRPKKPVSGFQKIAVSLERKGGVPKAEGPMVLLSQ